MDTEKKQFEIEVLQHTSHTGRYVTGEARVIEMAQRGLLHDHGPQPIAGGMHYLTLAEKGRKMLADFNQSLPPEKPTTAGRRRYLEFLNADSGLRFGDWLRRRHARRRLNIS